MKAGLLLVSLGLVAFAQATYDLSCAKSELSIRWPSYESNSEYYVCSRLFGRKMAVSCNPGEVFTFVLQSCTSPNRYIPAPAVENLPTADPLPSKPNEDGYLTPLDISSHPPLLNSPSVHVPVLEPQVGPPTLAAPVAIVEEHKPENIAAVVEETDNVTPPLPPTPAPTPPLVEKETSKKPAVKKPATKKKKTITTPNKKATAAGKQTGRKPSAAAGKKSTAQKSGKQNSKADKTPKKSVKTSNAKDKKTQKRN